MRVADLVALLFVFSLVSADFNAAHYWEKIKAKASQVATKPKFLDSLKNKFLKAEGSESQSSTVQEEPEVVQQDPSGDETENKDDEIILSQPGFLEGFIQGLQKNPNSQTECLTSYRNHKEVINTGIQAAFQNSNGNMMQGLMSVGIILANTTDLVSKCELLSMVANLGGILSITGMIGMVTRFGKNSWKLTRALAVVRLRDFHSIGRVVGVFVSIIVNIEITE